MTEFTQYLELALLSHTFKTPPTTYSSPAGIWMSLHTAVNSDTAVGTVVTGGGYNRQTVTFANAAAAPGIIENTAVTAFTASGAAYSAGAPIISTALNDNATAGNQLCFDNGFTSTVVNDADTLSFAIGAIDVTLD